MTTPSLRFLPRGLTAALVALCWWALSAPAFAAESPKSFDIPAESADRTLRQFSTQSGVEVVFGTASAAQVRTNAIKGDLAPREALARMLDGTGLIVAANERTGALTVSRDPNAQRAAPAATSVRPGETTGASVASDRAVQMEAMEVASTRVSGLQNTTLFRTDEQAALPFDVIDRAQIDRMGVTNVQELFRMLPESSNYGFSQQGNAGSQVSSNAAGTTTNDSVSLRGFANSNTVVLVNGRRLTGTLSLGAGLNNNGSNFGADIGKIPVALIERIEVLPASAGAIYGGGALGGVINVILRKDYNTKRITTYVGTSQHGGGTEYQFSLFQGFAFNKGRTQLSVSLDFTRRETMKAGQRDYLQRALAKYPSTDTRINPTTGQTNFLSYVLPQFSGMPGTLYTRDVTGLGIPGNPTAQFARIPTGITQASFLTLTPASFTATAGTFNDSHGKFDEINLYYPQETQTFQATLEHQILSDDRLKFFAEVSGSLSRNDYKFRQLSSSAAMAATFSQNPFRTGVTAGFVGRAVSIYFNDIDLPSSRTIQNRDNGRVTFGFQGKIGERWNWTVNTTGQYTRNYVESQVPTTSFPFYLSTTVLTPANATVVMTQEQRWANIYNPMVDHNLYPVPQSVIDGYFRYARIGSDIVKVATVEGSATGEAFNVPAGAVRLRPGFEVTWIDEPGYQRQPYSEGDFTLLGRPRTDSFVPTQASQTSKAAFAEVILPIISKSFRPVPVQEWEINASSRTDSTNTGRGRATSTYSSRLAVTTWLAFTASFTEGYTQLVPSAILPPTVTNNVSVTNLVDPKRGNAPVTTVIPTQLSGGNPNLKPQSSRAKNFGLIFAPKAIPGFNLTVRYSKIHQFNSVSAPTLAAMLATPANYPEDRITRGPLTPADTALGYTAGPILQSDISNMNIAQVYAEAVDTRIKFDLPVPESWGRLAFATSSTYNRFFSTKAFLQSAPINGVGIQSGNNPLKWKGSAELYWSKGNFGANIRADYIDRFKNGTTTPSVLFPTATGVDGDYIPSTATFDGQFSYQIPVGMGQSGWRKWVNGTRWTLGCKNLFDREPPFVSDATGFYSRYSSPMQRYFYVRMEKSL